MTVKVAIAQIQLEAGQRIVLDRIGWQEFEDILEDLGEHRHSHVAYYKGVLEFRMPLPEHERHKMLISHLLMLRGTLMMNLLLLAKQGNHGGIAPT